MPPHRGASINQKFTESEERAKNLIVIVFGLGEKEGEEDLSETVGEVFESLGENLSSSPCCVWARRRKNRFGPF